jgi:hypothetical protein
MKRARLYLIKAGGSAVAPGFTLDTLRLWADAEVFALTSQPVGGPMLEGRFHTLALRAPRHPLRRAVGAGGPAWRARATDRYEFALVILPLLVRGAFGSPANALTVL